MKVVTLVFALIMSSVALGATTNPPASGDTPPNMAIEAKHPDFVKNWYVGMGPVVSQNFLGTNGTKYNIAIGYAQGLSEHWNLLYFVDNNFNTASQGSTQIMTVNAGGQYFLRDRGADNSLFVQGDLGYGGGNRSNDANITGAAAVGFQFFRTAEFTFEAIVRVELLYTNSGSSLSGPNLTQIRLGVYF